ncbi:MAG: M48 family metallopeptidase, partial [Myxococcota bacterium]
MRPMNAPYPSAPAAVPPDLAKPTPSHRRHTLAAFGALVAFLLLYLGLAAWFGFTAWRLAMGAWTSPDGFFGYVLAVPPLFLFAFLVKGLFFVRKGDIGDAIELRPEDEPALFSFIHRVADEAGAPRPHRVFLTPDVNASVFYDLSLRNLVWPSRKNLNIGLGLVNVLTLDELKAVLAHEFGHFAQREMALGTWVYVARQAIGAVVARRDGFDRFLDGLSRVDLRLAWIGWGMRVIVWSIRVVLDTAFRGLVVLERALSREMEFQADLVSVSLCGSDSLVHGLRRIGPADDAMTRAMAFATSEGRAGRPIADLYAVQTGMLAKMRAMWNDPSLGEVPPRPEHAAAAHRVFSRGIAEVPRMWATHPPSHEREENAKARYVPSVLDPRPAWEVFADAAATRRRMTARLYAENMPEAAKAEVAPEADTRARLDEAFTRPALDPAWRGVYVGRSAVRGVRGYKDLFGPVPEDPDAVRAALDALYPDTIVETLRAWRDAESQVSQLEALQKGLLTAPGGVIRFRGRTIPRRDLAGVLAEARADRD